MISFELRPTLTTTAGIPLAAVLAPAAGLPQPVFDPVARSGQERQVLEEIQEKREQDGPYSLDLIDPMTALAQLYQESGDRDLAAAAFAGALQVVRANYGLHSLEQIPLLRQAIDNEQARGDHTAAWDLEQELLTLVERHPEDLRIVPVLHEIGDERMNILRRYLGSELPPQIYLGCYYRPVPQDPNSGNCRAGSRDDVIRSLLFEAWHYYTDAIELLLRNELYSSSELQEIERVLIRSSYLHGQYGMGSQSLRRLLAYDVANSAPWADRVNALVQMADWDLLFAEGHISIVPALETYQQAYDELEAIGATRENLEQIFSPKIPVVLPTFLPSPLNADDAQAHRYVDVSFEITKYGESRKIEILEAPNVARPARNDLVRLISRTRFRPRITSGRVADTSPITVRYYLSEE